MNNVAETIKNLRKYPHAADFFKDMLPSYVNETGECFIQVRRAFHELMGLPVGIHAGRYREEIFGVHLMSLINALRELEDQGKVQRRGRGVWVWKNGGKKQHGGKP